MNRTLIFGYGSLINLRSVEGTTKRKMQESDLSVVHLNGWARAWSYVVNCVFDGDGDQPTATLFLNIEREASSILPGVIFEVSQKELTLIDAREYGYTRINVTDGVDQDQGATIYSYIASPGFDSPTHEAVIPAQYHDIVSLGARNWGEEFEQSFWGTTKPHQFQQKPGDYGPYYPPS
ncbi:MAG: cation transport regulator ChaC [Planctomycetota bacterium]|jgi:cation transport regulator ChaC